MPKKIALVKIVHPGGLESHVDPVSVPEWERSGWTRADASAPTARPDDTTERPATRRSRLSKEES